MSGPIKPEDVPEKLAKDFDWTPRSQIAGIINAAVEAGLVSPPVYCIRQNGELRKYESGEVRVFSGKPLPWAYDTEHWRGQTD